MKIDIVSWECEGLRCPDMKFDLMENGEPAQVALIQMPNGTGKTTTLDMLTATLTGAALNWKSEDVTAMRRPGEERSTGRFRVDIQADGKPITFELLLDFIEGGVSYSTTTPATGGVIPKWEPPPNIRPFFTSEFIQLFVFDGEYAERLLKQDANEAERAIDALCQLYLVDEISLVAQEEWDHAIRGGGPTSTTGHTMTLNKLNKVSKRIIKVEKVKKVAQKEIRENEGAIDELEIKIQSHIANNTGLREQYDEAVIDRGAAQNDLDIKLVETMTKMRFPNALNKAFGNALVSLKSNLDRLKLPEATSKQFFIELAEEDACVCGRPLDQQTRETLLNRAKLYLGQDEIGSVNSIKQDIQEYCERSSEQPHEKCLDTVRKMSAAERQFSEMDQKVRALKQSLIDSGDDALKEMEDERDSLTERTDKLLELLDLIDAEPSSSENLDETYCLKALKAAKKELSEKLSKITNTLVLKQQTDILTEISQSAKKSARERLRDIIRDDCNKMLLNVLGNDPIQLEAIDNSLVIKRQKGASVGQTLSVGYTFLMSLLSRGNNHFPLVVDSPCGSLGGGRREAIGELIPKLCPQFITFVIDKERDDFASSLEQTCGGAIKYFTAFRDSPDTAHMSAALPTAGVSKTTNAYIVEDRDYFFNFKE